MGRGFWSSKEPGEPGGVWLEMSPEPASEEGADLSWAMTFVEALALTLGDRSLRDFEQTSGKQSDTYLNRLRLQERGVWGGGLCNSYPCLDSLPQENAGSHLQSPCR